MTTLSLQPDGTTGLDTMIREAVPTRNDGAALALIVGRDATVNRCRMLIQFNVSSIPAGANVTVATLTLVSLSVENATARNISCHRGLTQWYEGAQSNADPAPGEDASTWNLRNANGALAWGALGGLAGTDYAAVATATTSVTTAGTYTWNVLPDVAAWVNGSATNRGWWVIGNEATSSTRKYFRASDDTTPANRPLLTITYSKGCLMLMGIG